MSRQKHKTKVRAREITDVCKKGIQDQNLSPPLPWRAMRGQEGLSPHLPRNQTPPNLRATVQALLDSQSPKSAAGQRVKQGFGVAGCRKVEERSSDAAPAGCCYRQPSGPTGLFSERSVNTSFLGAWCCTWHTKSVQLNSFCPEAAPWRF